MKKQLLLLLAVIYSVAAFAQDKVAVLYVYPNDVDSKKLFTKTELENQFNVQIKAFWDEQSYGKYKYTATVFHVMLPLTSSQTVPANGHYVHDMLQKLLPNGLPVPGYDPSQYAFNIILLGGNIGGFGGGQSKISLKVNGQAYTNINLASFSYLHPSFYGKLTPDPLRFYYYPSGAAFKSRKGGESISYPELGLDQSFQTLLHEWGHGIGLSSHANVWRSEVEPLYGEMYWWKQNLSFWDQEGDYGNNFDIMGGNPNLSLHINAFYKDLKGWFAANEKITLTGTQKDVTIFPLELQAAGSPKCAFYQIPANTFTRPANFGNTNDYAFYIEYRQPMGIDKHLAHEYAKSNTEGLMVCMTRRKGDSFIASWLLDMSPDNVVYDKSPTFINPKYNNEPDNHEATLNAGKTFYDDQTGFCLTNIRPKGLAGITFDFEKGKKSGVASGVHTTAVFSGQSVSGKGTPILYSSNLAWFLEIQNDGKVVVKNSSTKSVNPGGVSASIPVNTAANRFSLESGNLILWDANNVKIWQSNTSGNFPNTRLIVNNEGSFRVVDANNVIVWL